MKAIAFQNRLCRDLTISSVNELPADIRQEILDAINGSLQKFHSLAPPSTKEVQAGIFLPAPKSLTLTVTNGSTTIEGGDFVADEYYRTLRIDGDTIDNQPMGLNELLHPYAGESGQVSATLYGDAISVPKLYTELISQHLKNLDTDTLITHALTWPDSPKSVGRPDFFVVEPNARNRNPDSPAIIRFDCLPDRLYRLQGAFSIAPVRVVYSDLLTPGVDLPIRDEWIESCLLPIARGSMTSCRLWRDEQTKAKARDEATEAERRLDTLYPMTLATPNNHVGTPLGF